MKWLWTCLFLNRLPSRAARTPRDGTLRWVVEQGFEMGRPSIIHIEADKANGNITAVRVGGSTVVVSKGELLGI